jgi:hypothetical protein
MNERTSVDLLSFYWRLYFLRLMQLIDTWWILCRSKWAHSQIQIHLTYLNWTTMCLISCVDDGKRESNFAERSAIVILKAILLRNRAKSAYFIFIRLRVIGEHNYSSEKASPYTCFFLTKRCTSVSQTAIESRMEISHFPTNLHIPSTN